MTAITISSVAFTKAGDADVRTGLLGYVTCILNDALMLDGITLRRTADGRLALSYPSRRDGRGRQHPLVRPIGDAVRRDLERQVFAQLGIEEGATP